MITDGHDDVFICVEDDVTAVVMFDEQGMYARRQVYIDCIQMGAEADGRNLAVAARFSVGRETACKDAFI